jgi:hypothetical protein
MLQYLTVSQASADPDNKGIACRRYGFDGNSELQRWERAAIIQGR